jgi:opine dehydrogenase
MHLAVLGAGAVGPAAAALAVSRGHSVALWSPRGGGTHGIGAALHVEGVLAGTAVVEVAVDVTRALRGAAAVLVAVPPHALGPVLRRIAPMLAEGVPVLLAPSPSLAPLLLDRLLAREGVRAPIGALAVPPAVASRSGPDRVRILALRDRVEIAAVPAAEAPALAQLCAALFGVPFLPVADLVAAALASPEPVLQAALALGNLTRIEGAEAWDVHEQMTPAVCRVMARLDAERLALGAALGAALAPLPELLHRAGGIPMGPLPAMARALATARGPTPGPQGLDAAHLAESVTYGLAFWLRLGSAQEVAMPLTAASVAVLEAMWGNGLSGDDLLEGLDLAQLPVLLREGHPRQAAPLPSG